MDDLVIKVPKSVFKPEVTLEIGSRIKIDAPTGKSYVGTIVAMDEQTFTLDLNHLLAGKRLVVNVTVVSIAEQSEPVIVPSSALFFGKLFIDSPLICRYKGLNISFDLPGRRFDSYDDK